MIGSYTFTRNLSTNVFIQTLFYDFRTKSWLSSFDTGVSTSQDFGMYCLDSDGQTCMGIGGESNHS